MILRIEEENGNMMESKLSADMDFEESQIMERLNEAKHKGIMKKPHNKGQKCKKL